MVKGSDPSKLKYKLTNIQLEYEMIHSEMLAKGAANIYESGKEFAYDHVQLDKVVPINRGTETRINIKVNAQRRSLKGHSLSICVALHCGDTRFGKVHLP